MVNPTTGSVKERASVAVPAARALRLEAGQRDGNVV
jgi:hypothetical protein